MEKLTFNTEQIISRLEFFNFNYELDKDILKINLPLFCYLKIKINDDSVKLTSRIRFGFSFLSLEWNFIIYGLILYLLAYFQWITLNRGIFVLLGLFVIYFVVCFMKIETMKKIVHNWIEKDSWFYINGYKT